MRGARRTVLDVLALLWCILGAVGCALLAVGTSLPPRHPEALSARGNPICTDCHDPEDDPSQDYDGLSHRGDWLEAHPLRASAGESLCGMCHPQRFCAVCHGARLELKPSLYEATRPDRTLPHRGDYLSRHRIDARLDPTGCVRCHGNPRASKTCVPCHG